MCLLSMARHFSAIDCWANVLNPCGDSMMASRRETLCLIRPRLSIPNCFVRTYELAFSLYGRNSTTQRNGMPCAVIDFLFFFFLQYIIFFFFTSHTMLGNIVDEFTGMQSDREKIRSQVLTAVPILVWQLALTWNETPRGVGDACVWISNFLNIHFYIGRRCKLRSQRIVIVQHHLTSVVGASRKHFSATRCSFGCNLFSTNT